MQSNKSFKRNLLALSVMAALGATNVQADHDGQWYAGLNLQFGNKIVPLFVGGYRHANVDNDGDPRGVDLGVLLGLDGFQGVKLKGFAGSDCIQGELGVGFNFKQNAMMFTGGVQGGHVAGGIDYTLGGVGFNPYLGVNTIGCYDDDNNGYNGYDYG